VTHPLTGITVVDFSSGIAGGYCTRILADGGADVVKLESPNGDPLREWSASSSRPDGEDGALFAHLSAGKRSVVIDPHALEAEAEVQRWVSVADMIVWSPGSDLAGASFAAPEHLRQIAPHASVLALTPFGLTGPWSNLPASELTLQAWSGGMGGRGEQGKAPISAGGRTGEWLTGMFGALGLLASRWRNLDAGTGELLDASALESIILTHTMYPVTYLAVSGQPTFAKRAKNFPGVEFAKDGLVAFMVVTGQQWLDFCAMVGRPDWIEDESLIYVSRRAEHRDVMAKHINAWMAERTVDEIVELATAFRIPVAPVGNGATIPTFDHFDQGAYFTRHPVRGFLQPAPPYRFHGTTMALAPPADSPTLGQDTGSEPSKHTDGQGPAGTTSDLPFSGLKIADFTAFWAGPILGNVMGMLGADVIHVESIQRPDGMRFRTAKAVGEPQWWETGPSYLAGNTNKRGLTLDMGSEQGRELALKLIASSDVVVENYTPRVFESWGLTWDEIHKVNPKVIMVRMPGFGIEGPWRDRSGYAQNMEAVSGLAWLTGTPDEEPQLLNGVGDPVAGTHATLGLLFALEHRRRTGEGMLVESPMVGAALAIAAEQVIEHSAYGALLTRDGNRGPHAAPQNVYLAADIDDDGTQDSWVALSVTSDREWAQLCLVLGAHEWASDPSLATLGGRRKHHDRLDERISQWCSVRTRDDAVDALTSAGVPAAPVLKAEQQSTLLQLSHREFFEDVDHPVVGVAPYGGYPVTFSSLKRPLIRSSAPLLGQHNHEVLTELGLSPDEIAELENDNIIGTQVRR
jgi:crotonobetainyl-CoA:carnitine CoA-transferase CaiB-like acyl-CoA transferase